MRVKFTLIPVNLHKTLPVNYNYFLTGLIYKIIKNSSEDYSNKGYVLKRKYFAHSLEGRQVNEWHSLDEHLKGTAELAAFAAEFGYGEWGSEG